MREMASAYPAEAVWLTLKVDFKIRTIELEGKTVKLQIVSHGPYVPVINLRIGILVVNLGKGMRGRAG